MRVHIISGLPLDRLTSFTYQVRSLAGALRVAGVEVAVDSASDAAGRPPASASETGKRTILLGYPDQFPFLGGEGTAGEASSCRDLYLWSQFSKPIDPPSLGPALPVPLTEKTALILRRSGVERTGPVIPHGVDTAVFGPKAGRSESRGRATITIGSVGANNYRKRWDTLFEAFALFCSRYALWAGPDKSAKAARPWPVPAPAAH